MNVYAISDLHLSGALPKPMNIFGEKWEGHFSKICEDWQSKVSGEDIVLICGDISWADNLNDALVDLNALKGLRGTKIFIKGNHDYWWSGITKLRDSKPDSSFTFLQNDAVKIGDVVFCGSRGWTCPGSDDYTEADQKIYLREAERFKLCFYAANKLRQEGDRLVALIHYPPFSLKTPETDFTRLFEQNDVNKVVFGHLHGEGYFPYRTEKNGVEYILSSCDKVNFKLVKIL